MKKTININLGGQPFIIDEQAYDILHHYFEALKQKFTNENEQKEILSDIEARVAEVFTQRLGKSKAVVSEEDVVYIISLMGRPEDIAGETDSPAPGQQKKDNATSSPSYTGPVEKKFFRDPDNKKVGGVISGLCHYFGWGDPTWIRIAIVILIVLSLFAHLSLGFPLAIIYLILLIVVPEANTSAEKLQMRGQPVTIQNIEKEVREAMTTAGNSINSMVKDNNAGGRFLSALLMVGRIIIRIVSVILLLICILFMLCLLSLFFGLSFLTEVSLSDMAHLLISSRGLIMLAHISIFLAIGLPLISVMYDVIRFLANSKVKNPIFKRVVWTSWVGSIILLFLVGTLIAKDFNATDTVKDKVVLLAPKGGTLRVALSDSASHKFYTGAHKDEEFPDEIFHNDLFIKTDYGYALGAMKLEVAVSPDSNFYVEKIAFSRGLNYADANKNIQMMKYKFSQNDTTLFLDNKFELPKQGKWRSQKIKIRIYVPEGKHITFADNIDRIETTVRDNDYLDGLLSGKILEVQDGQLKCINCEESIIINDNSEAPDAPDAPEAPESPASHKSSHSINIQTGSGHDNLKNVSVNINQNGVSMTGQNDKDEKVKVKVSDQGVKIITIDSNGNTKVTKK